MEIIIAENTGFCSGVKKAIQGAKKALKEKNRIYCLGDIIHNPGVVKELERKGMVFVKNIDQIPPKMPFIIRSHGLPFETIKKIENKECSIFDFTCPKVKKSHRLAIRLTKSKKKIAIIGNPEHPEVKAIFSLTNGNAIILEKPDDVDSKINDREYHVLVQTTFMPERFYDIVRAMVPKTKTLVIHNTLCEETIKRQQEVKELAKNADLIVVVGGKHSSNTRTLFSIAKSQTDALHIENSDELDINIERIKKAEKIGIVSGASTPESEVKKVYKKILKIKND